MSSKNYHSEPVPPMQEVDLNDAAWNEVVSTRLPANLEAQARQLKAWRRKREVRSVERSVTRVVGVRQLPVLFQRTGHVGGAQRHWLAV